MASILRAFLATLQESALTKLQVDPSDGIVWAVEGRHEALPTGLDPEEYAVRCGRAAHDTVRILGSRENAPLIAAMAREHARGGPVVELGRPGHVDWTAMGLLGVKTLLFEVRQADADAPSRGGWHPMVAGEAIAYELAALRVRHLPGEPPTWAFLALLRQHPAYPALAFIRHLDPMSLGQLLAAILDPRWFVDPDAPDRMARLKSYLGLASEEPRGSRDRQARRALCLRTWKTTWLPPRVRGPGDFLWRHWEVGAAGKGGMPRPTWRPA